MMARRLSTRMLMELRGDLSERDISVLGELMKCKRLKTDHLQRLCFTGHTTGTVALRATNRALLKLQGYGLIKALERRIGGVRAGSRGYVWLPTEAGDRLLHLDDPDYRQRKRLFEPSRAFLTHTLEIAEAYVRLREVGRRRATKLVQCDLEPLCWRNYGFSASKRQILKPDLYAVTGGDGYSDHWFLEIDLCTEAPTVVLDKCRRYVEYLENGAEQKRIGVFPLVVWIVPDGKRKSSLTQQIAGCRDLRYKNIFTVIMMDEFEPLIESGADMKGENCG